MKEGDNDWFPDLHSKNNKIECWAFAPPPVFHPIDKIKKEHAENVYVFINNNDIVPRLSTAALLNLFVFLRQVDKHDYKMTTKDF